MKIRIIAGGIFGLPLSDESPNGEYPVGHEIDLGDNDPPAGWSGRYEIIGAILDGAEFVTGQSAEGDEKAPRRARPNR